MTNHYCYLKSGLFFCIVFLFFFIFNQSSFAYNDDETAQPFISAIVVDANDGKVLYSYKPDKKIYPASLTKMMTAYLTFDAIKNGSIGLNDEVKTNNLTDKITVNNLILKMIVISSNPATEFLAEEISGNIKDFVFQMNNTAKKIGMKNTNFTNTHGLFNKNHYSTARDIAVLAIRMVFDFPKYSEYFSIANYIDENGNFKKNTSDIQQNIRGIEGGKTGYIEASGYNIAAWGTYGEKRIFVVIIGADNKVNRDALVIRLINNAIGKNIENTLPTKHKNIIDNNDISNLLYFFNINPDNYTAPQPIERKSKEHTMKQTKKIEEKTKYFYKKNKD